MLSEDDIKRIGLAFLKSHYRLRPRDESAPVLSGVNLRGEGNIIADAILQFRQPDGKIFTATVEATSDAVRREVHFRTRWPMLYWDTFTWSVLMTAVLLTIFHVYEVYPVLRFGWGIAIALAIGLIAFFCVCFYVLLRFAPRYRYIYAVDQFKQYHADEQWVVFSEEVFDADERFAATELRRQCVEHGFGLIRVKRDGKPELLVAPSLSDNFGGTRRTISLIPIQDMRRQWETLSSRAQATVRGVTPRFRQWLDQLGWQRLRWRNPLPDRVGEVVSQTYRRLLPGYKQPYNKQKLLTALGLVVLVVLFLRQWEKRPIRYVNEPLYTLRMRSLETRPETDYVLIDAPIAPFFDSNFSFYLLPGQDDQFADIVEPLTTLPTPETGSMDVRVVVASPGQAPAFYFDCARYFMLDTTVYVLRDTFYPALDAARLRLDAINGQGLDALAVWSACLSNANLNVGYQVLVGGLYADSLEAARLRPSLETALEELATTLELQAVN